MCLWESHVTLQSHNTAKQLPAFVLHWKIYQMWEQLSST